MSINFKDILKWAAAALVAYIVLTAAVPAMNQARNTFNLLQSLSAEFERSGDFPRLSEVQRRYQDLAAQRGAHPEPYLLLDRNGRQPILGAEFTVSRRIPMISCCKLEFDFIVSSDSNLFVAVTQFGRES